MGKDVTTVISDIEQKALKKIKELGLDINELLPKEKKEVKELEVIEPSTEDILEDELAIQDKELDDLIEKCKDDNLELSDEDIETINSLVDDAIKETKELSDEEVSKKIQEKEKAFVDYNRLYLQGLDISRDIQEFRKEDYKLAIHAITELHYLKKNQSKYSFKVMAIIFACGLSMGAIAMDNKKVVSEIGKPLIELFGLANKNTGV